MDGEACAWSHRIFTPLTSILMDLERILGEHEHARLERVHRNVDALHAVMRDWLEHERMAAKDEALARHAVEARG